MTRVNMLPDEETVHENRKDVVITMKGQLTKYVITSLVKLPVQNGHTQARWPILDGG